ncbi:MAG: 3-phenylpropionate/cinnamic acid dioxygenase subunit beta [Deltaproteobacteria bacterium]|nr:3-phenylpropionate/cinnamic acid dioxygenase subunit beta [Deltaproteobacteria bacterium]
MPADPLYSEILHFLYLEAKLLDDRRFSEWLNLLAEDISYRMPLPLNKARTLEYSPQTEILSENIDSLRVRVNKLTTEFAWADTPPSRTRHLIANVAIKTTNKAEQVEASSFFLLSRTRLGEPSPDLYSGERQDLVRKVNGAWRLAKRTILLDQTVVGARHLNIFF